MCFPFSLPRPWRRCVWVYAAPSAPIHPLNLPNPKQPNIYGGPDLSVQVPTYLCNCLHRHGDDSGAQFGCRLTPRWHSTLPGSICIRPALQPETQTHINKSRSHTTNTRPWHTFHPICDHVPLTGAAWDATERLLPWTHAIIMAPATLTMWRLVIARMRILHSIINQ